MCIRSWCFTAADEGIRNIFTRTICWVREYAKTQTDHCFYFDEVHTVMEVNKWHCHQQSFFAQGFVVVCVCRFSPSCTILLVWLTPIYALHSLLIPADLIWTENISFLESTSTCSSPPIPSGFCCCCSTFDLIFTLTILPLKPGHWPQEPRRLQSIAP